MNTEFCWRLWRAKGKWSAGKSLWSSCGDKERMFLEAQENDGNRIYYPNVSQQDFEKIPGAPIGYWVSDKVKEIFTSNLALSAVASPCVGLQTADNARFDVNISFTLSDTQ